MTMTPTEALREAIEWIEERASDERIHGLRASPAKMEEVAARWRSALDVAGAPPAVALPPAETGPWYTAALNDCVCITTKRAPFYQSGEGEDHFVSMMPDGSKRSCEAADRIVRAHNAALAAADAPPAADVVETLREAQQWIAELVRAKLTEMQAIIDAAPHQQTEADEPDMFWSVVHDDDDLPACDVVEWARERDQCFDDLFDCHALAYSKFQQVDVEFLCAKRLSPRKYRITVRVPEVPTKDRKYTAELLPDLPVPGAGGE